MRRWKLAIVACLLFAAANLPARAAYPCYQRCAIRCAKLGQDCYSFCHNDPDGTCHQGCLDAEVACFSECWILPLCPSGDG